MTAIWTCLNVLIVPGERTDQMVTYIKVTDFYSGNFLIHSLIHKCTKISNPLPTESKLHLMWWFWFQLSQGIKITIRRYFLDQNHNHKYMSLLGHRFMLDWMSRCCLFLSCFFVGSHLFQNSSQEIMRLEELRQRHNCLIQSIRHRKLLNHQMVSLCLRYNLSWLWRMSPPTNMKLPFKIWLAPKMIPIAYFLISLTLNMKLWTSVNQPVKAARMHL